jgi:hypothetical protein
MVFAGEALAILGGWPASLDPNLVVPAPELGLVMLGWALVVVALTVRHWRIHNIGTRPSGRRVRR